MKEVIKFLDDGILIDKELAKKYLDKNDYNCLIHIANRVNKENEITKKEMDLLFLFSLKIKDKQFHNKMKMFSYITIFGIIYAVIAIVFSFIGINKPVFDVIAGIMFLIMHFGCTVLLLYSKSINKYWKQSHLLMRGVWWFAFLLNMFLFADQLLDLLNIHISF